LFPPEETTVTVFVIVLPRRSDVADKPEIGCTNATPIEPLDVFNCKPFAVGHVTM